MPVLTVLLVLANIGAYLLELALGGHAACRAFGLVPAQFVETGAPAPLFTSLFLHDPSTVAHIGLNMVCLAAFGAVVEAELGSAWLVVVYFASGALGGLLHVAVDPSATAPLVGASGAIYGVMALAAALRPQLIGFALILAGVDVWHAFAGGAGSVSFGTHIGGFCTGVTATFLLNGVVDACEE